MLSKIAKGIQFSVGVKFNKKLEIKVSEVLSTLFYEQSDTAYY
jgi:hypothetical protein